MTTSKKRRVSRVAAEVGSADLGDKRLNERLVQIVDAMAARPEASIPQQAVTEAAREATYQFLNNPRVAFNEVLAPHLERTVERAGECETVLAIHDTTEFHFRGDGHRDGLGRLGRGSGEGFFCHLSLGVGLHEARRPLGVLGVETFVREERRKPKRKPSRRLPDREALRWGRLIDEVENRVGDEARLVHVLDSEGDIYEVLLALQQQGRGFVIRAGRDRALKPAEGEERSYLFSRVQLEAPIAETFATLSKRTRRGGKQLPATRRNQPREARQAVLDIRAMATRIQIPDQARGQRLATSVEINVVSVTERNPPVGAEAVNWTLLTSEPIDNEAAVRNIIEAYRARWLIEEYFKAIKTGCAYEKAQLESYRALLIHLAMTLPVAYDLLLARYLSRAAPETPATDVFSLTLIAVLKHEVPGKLSTTPTVAETLSAVARLGGHIKSNGPPGWAVIGRGYERALLIERGWRAARSLERCDQ